MNKNKMIRIAVIAVVGLFVFSIIRDVAIKSIVTIATSKITGAPVKIGSFKLGIMTQSVKIKNFKLYNPKGFSKDVMIDIPTITVDCNAFALLTGKLHMQEVAFDLREMIVEKNKEGQLNVDALAFAQQGEDSKKKTSVQKDKEEAKSSQPSKPMKMQIDVVRLNIGKVVYKDYSKGDQPVIQVYDVNVNDKTYKNITSAQQLATLIMVEAMGPTAIKGAKMYAAATILGVGFLPAGIAGALIGKDTGKSEYNVAFNKAFNVSKQIVEKAGTLKSANEKTGLIKAKVDKADITVQVTKIKPRKTAIEVKARKMMLPKPEIAEGIIYQISEKLK